jgi:hypothetical protein
MKVQRIANPFTVYESQIPHQIPFARVLERVYENQIPIQKPFLKGFLRNLTNAKKGFFIRCTSGVTRVGHGWVAPNHWDCLPNHRPFKKLIVLLERLKQKHTRHLHSLLVLPQFRLSQLDALIIITYLSKYRDVCSNSNDW